MSTISKLPSFKQPGESCWLIFGHGMVANNAEVLKVHFSKNKVQYDVEAILHDADDPEKIGWHRVRFYNVDEVYVKDPTSAKNQE